LTSPPSSAELRSSAVAMYSIDAEWKKQVYTMESEQTAYQLIAELSAKRMEARSEIGKSRERLEALVAQLMVVKMGSYGKEVNAARNAAIAAQARQ